MSRRSWFLFFVLVRGAAGAFADRLPAVPGQKSFLSMMPSPSVSRAIGAYIAPSTKRNRGTVMAASPIGMGPPPPARKEMSPARSGAVRTASIHSAGVIDLAVGLARDAERGLRRVVLLGEVHVRARLEP